MKPSNENLSCADLDDNMIKEFEQSELGIVVGSRFTPRPTARMIMVSNQTSVGNKYFDLCMGEKK